MVRTESVLAVVLTLMMSSCGWLNSVDETGYNNPETNGPGVDETGYMDADQVYWSSEEPLSATPQSVWVIGLAGAVSDVNGTVMIDNAGVYTPALLADDGGFVVSPIAALGDQVTLVYTSVHDTVERLPLMIDNLENADGAAFEGEGEDADQPGGGADSGMVDDSGLGGDSDSPTDGLTSLVSAPDADGLVTVELGEVPEGTLVVAFNEYTGATASALPGDTVLVIAADVGHRLCLFGHTTTPTTTWCVYVTAD